MTTFCLIHSSVQGPNGWALLVNALKELGHRTITPDLGGIDADSNALSYAAVIAESIENNREIAEDLWILAHSASGMFLPWVPQALPDTSIKGLVYLAAYAPVSGTSLLGTLETDPTMFNPEWLGQNPMDDAIARDFLFHDCDEDTLRWALSTRRLMIARRAMLEQLPAELRDEIPNKYIACREDRTVAPAWMRRAARDRLGVEPIEIDGGHCPHVSRPKDLALLLNGL